MGEVVFAGKKYPVVRVNIGPGLGSRLVSVVSLQQALEDMPRNFTTNTEEADRIDDMIYYYVEDDEILLPMAKLEKIVREEAGE